MSTAARDDTVEAIESGIALFDILDQHSLNDL